MAANQREKVLRQIRALLVRTIENGCTEAEAIEAAAKAADLLERYNLTREEAELREEGFKEAAHNIDDVVGQHLWKVASAISRLCDVKTWTDGGARFSSKLTFFGLESDVEVAGYLLAVAERAMRDATLRFEGGQRLMRDSIRRRRVLAFVDGMADRLKERIAQIAWVRRRETSGKGLVVVKKALIDAELKRQGRQFKDEGDRFSQSSLSNYLDGRAAADSVALDASLTSGAASRVLAARI